MKRSFALAIVATLQLPLSAATHTWSGAVNGDWSNAGNWSAGGAPGNGEANVVLNFPFAQSNMNVMHNDLIGLDVTSITFTDTAYDVSGNSINLNGSIRVNGGTGGAAAVVRFPIALTGLATFVANGFGFVAGGEHLELRGSISGSQSVAVDSATFGDQVRLLAANTYTFGTTMSAAGTLVVGHPLALGATGGPLLGTSVASGGALFLDGVTVAGEDLSIAGSGTFQLGALRAIGSAPSAWTGPIALTLNTVFQAPSAGAPLTVSGVLSGNHALILDGLAGITLTANNTYSGTTFIGEGPNFINGNQPASANVNVGTSVVGTSSTLGGVGTVGAISSVGTGASPTLVSPGLAGGTGILTCAGVQLSGDVSAHLVIQLDGTTAGTQHDRVTVNGAVSLLNGPALDVTVGYVPSLGHSFRIIDNDGADAVTGTFAGLPEGATFVASGRTLQISYVGGTGNDVVLSVTSLTPAELTGFDAE